MPRRTCCAVRRSPTPLLLALLAAVLAWAPAASAILIDFDGLAHGEPVSDQFLASDGVQISVVNQGGGPDLGIAFDSTETMTDDPDLEGPDWAAGNLSGQDLGRLLIIAENDDGIDDGFVDDPDDEGSRPAGIIRVAFSLPVRSFGLDLIDVDSLEKENGALRFFSGGGEVGLVTFDQLPVRDASVVFGDNSANEILAILASELQVEGFDRVDIELGGSGAVDNLRFERVPEPATGVLAALGLGAGLVVSRRR